MSIYEVQNTGPIAEEASVRKAKVFLPSGSLHPGERESHRASSSQPSQGMLPRGRAGALWGAAQRSQCAGGGAGERRAGQACARL